MARGLSANGPISAKMVIILRNPGIELISQKKKQLTFKRGTPTTVRK